MTDENYLIDPTNLKFAIKIAKMFLFVLVLSIVYLVFNEWTRMTETRNTMAMFTRIAGNYALSSSQDMDSLTDADRTSYGTMYDEDEYKTFLLQLKDASASNTGLSYAYAILWDEYDRVKDEPGTLDDKLKYTPMSFNIPYLSSNILKQCYTEAMNMMVSNYNCYGAPSILLCNGVLTDFDGNVHDTCEYSCTGLYDYGNGLKFDVVEMTSAVQRSIYGVPDFFDKAITDVLANLDTNLYKDPRVDMGGALATNAGLIQYNITFDTPYYYITNSRLLAFGNVTGPARGKSETVKTPNNGTPNSTIDTINAYEGAYCYSRGDNGKRATDCEVYKLPDLGSVELFYKTSQPKSGQLCMFMSRTDDFIKAQFQYMYLS